MFLFGMKELGLTLKYCHEETAAEEQPWKKDSQIFLFLHMHIIYIISCYFNVNKWYCSCLYKKNKNKGQLSFVSWGQHHERQLVEVCVQNAILMYCLLHTQFKQYHMRGSAAIQNFSTAVIQLKAKCCRCLTAMCILWVRLHANTSYTVWKTGFNALSANTTFIVTGQYTVIWNVVAALF